MTSVHYRGTLSNCLSIFDPFQSAMQALEISMETAVYVHASSFDFTGDNSSL